MNSKEIGWQLADRLGDDLFAFSEVSETKHEFLTTGTIPARREGRSSRPVGDIFHVGFRIIPNQLAISA